MAKTINTHNSNDTEPKPKTKERSVNDFNLSNLDQLELQFAPSWQSDISLETGRHITGDLLSFHFDLLHAVISRFENDGWDKEELREVFAKLMDDHFGGVEFS